MKQPTDKQRLDWIERQGNGESWVARQSYHGGGFRLHNTRLHDHFLARATARQAIDTAMELEENIRKATEAATKDVCKKTS